MGGDGTPKICQNICRLKIYWYQKKKTSTLACAIKKINLRGPILDGFWRSGLEKFRETKLRLQLNNFTQKLDFDVLQEKKSAQDLDSKNKKEKQNLSWPKVG